MYALQVKQLLVKNSQEHVIATCRNPNGAAGLIELKNKFSERLHIQRLDLTIESTIEVTSCHFSFNMEILNNKNRINQIYFLFRNLPLHPFTF